MPHNRLLVALLLFLHLWGWPDASRDEGGGGPNAHNQKRAANGQPVYSKHGAGSPAFGNIPVELVRWQITGEKPKILAGSESMAGVFIMDVLPEESARILRKYMK